MKSVSILNSPLDSQFTTNISSSISVEKKEEYTSCAIQISATTVPLLLSTMRNVVQYNLVSCKGKLFIIYSHDNVVYHALEISVSQIVGGISVQINLDNLLDLSTKLAFILKIKPEIFIQIYIHMNSTSSQIIFHLGDDMFLIYPVINLDPSATFLNHTMKMINDQEKKKDSDYVCRSPYLINSSLSVANTQAYIASLEKNQSSLNYLLMQNRISTIGFSLYKKINSNSSLSSLIFSASIFSRQDMDPKMTALLTVIGPEKNYLKIKYLGQGIYDMIILASFYPNLETTAVK